VSISGFKSSVSATPSVPILPGKKPVLPASSLIYQNADVGVDLGSTRRIVSRGQGFIKPAHVDAPNTPPVLPAVENAGAQVKRKTRTTDTSHSSTHSTVISEVSPRKKRKK